jgi:hypothetical protein
MSFLSTDLARELHDARRVEFGQSRRAHQAAAATRMQRRAQRLAHRAERASRRAERAASQARLAVAKVL